MNPLNPSLTTRSTLILGALFLVPLAFAPRQSFAQEAETSSFESTLDQIWNAATLYEDEDNPFIKKISFVGRYHGQFVDSHTDQPASGGDRYWDHRRWRAGVKMALGHDLTFTNTYNLDTSQHFNGDRFIASVEEMHFEWEPTDDFYVIVGKQKPKITREYTTSSKRILTFERSTIVNNVIADKLWGVAVGFAALGLDHEVGLFANAYEDDWRWPSFDDFSPVATYRTSTPICESTDLFFDYQFTDTAYSGGEDYAASPYEHVVAIGTESDWGAFDLVVDLIGAWDREGDTRLDNSSDDSWGLVVMPSYDLTEKLQFVTKYSFASDARITHPQRRAGTRPDVDNLHTVYAGFNYRIYGDKLKLMAGYEIADADHAHGTGGDNYNNDTWLFGVRAYW